MSLRYGSSGHSGQISLGSTPSRILSAANLTVVTWIAPESAPSWMIGLSSIASVGGWRQWIGFGSGNVFFERRYSTTEASARASLPSDGRWQFIAGIDNGAGNVPEIYQGEENTVVADALTSSYTPAGSLVTSGTPSLALMNNAAFNNAGFHGKMAFAAYFDSALSLAEIKAIQFSPITASLAHPDLVALYMPGMHGTGNVYDFSGNGQDSTGITGSPTLNDLPAVDWGFPDIGGDSLFVSIGGVSAVSGDGSSVGTSTASGAGSSTAAGSGASDGSSTATGVGSAIAGADGASDGSSTATGQGAALAVGDGSSAGSSTVSGVSEDATASSGQSDGSSTATGDGQSVVAGVGVSGGNASASGDGQSIAAADGASSGSATAASGGHNGPPSTRCTSTLSLKLGF